MRDARCAMRDARDARARRTVVQSYSRGASGGWEEGGIGSDGLSLTVEVGQVVWRSCEWSWIKGGGFRGGGWVGDARRNLKVAPARWTGQYVTCCSGTFRCFSYLPRERVRY